MKKETFICRFRSCAKTMCCKAEKKQRNSTPLCRCVPAELSEICYKSSYTTLGARLFFRRQNWFLTPFCNLKRYFSIFSTFSAQNSKEKSLFGNTCFHTWFKAKCSKKSLYKSPLKISFHFERISYLVISVSNILL